MRQLIGILWLVTQLAPFAGAGVCAHEAMRSETECSEPMQGMPQDSHHGRSNHSQDCAQMFVCAPVAQFAPVATTSLTAVVSFTSNNYSSPASLFPGDPIAPPQPPPIG